MEDSATPRYVMGIPAKVSSDVYIELKSISDKKVVNCHWEIMKTIAKVTPDARLNILHRIGSQWCIAYQSSCPSLMLPWRVFIRPGTLRSQLQRRFIFPSTSQSQFLPLPNTWLAKIRFRADGKPRSKLIGFGFGEYAFYFFITFFVNKLIDTSVFFDLKDLLFCWTCHWYISSSEWSKMRRQSIFLWRIQSTSKILIPPTTLSTLTILCPPYPTTKGFVDSRVKMGLRILARSLTNGSII